MSEIPKRYNPSETESRWYKHWEVNGYFRSKPDDREPYSIVIPPPNVTGVLHMGHMLNNTIQDVLIRKARLEGKNACWVPGTDHASIATEAKVVRMLREKGIKKSDISRDQFLEYAWEWKHKYGGIILEQLKKLGASCDWTRTAFTMDETRSEAVTRIFIDLYNSGKLYRKLRMINWDPQARTVLSNEEVIYNDEDSELIYVKYKVVGLDDYLVIATQRPETIMGDTAVAVHPEDSRYDHLKGRNVLIPLINREVPVVFDEYVDREFGTGALKITPAHDPNDYEIGLKHKLEIIDTIDEEGRLNEKAQIHVGLDRFEARKKVIGDLENAGLLVKRESYRTSIGRSERTQVIVEPKLSLQWYVDMKALAAPALAAVMNDEIQFFPRKYKNTYKHWMENIRDWCVSRQLWWGHRIPAWYKDEHVFVAKTESEALEMARKKLNDSNIQSGDLQQDEDVLDTWFSSWLWPITVFDGFNQEEELNYYYPTNVLVTAWDIIFLWVARMIMSGYEWKNEKPFDHVYFTGMVRDKLGRKMSKSLGNSPDALKLLEEYGADGVRYGMLSCSPAGGDLLFDEKLCETGRNFCNKIWNALRLLKSFNVDETLSATSENRLAILWFEQKLNQQIENYQRHFDSYRLSELLVELYSFVWNDLCSFYLEVVKPKYGESIDRESYDKTVLYFEKILVLLHPFMPFVTEEIWHHLRVREEGDDCMVSRVSKPGKYDTKLLVQFDSIRQLITNVRDLRNANHIAFREQLPLYVEDSHEARILLGLGGAPEIVQKLANLKNFSLLDLESEKDRPNLSFLSGNQKYYCQVENKAQDGEEKDKIAKDLMRIKAFVHSIEKKLSNSGFVDNAPKEIVDRERKKLEDGKQKIRILEENLQTL